MSGGIRLSYLDDNNFIQRLQEGINTRVMIMTHNAYWPYFECLQNRYTDVCIHIFGSSMWDLDYAIRRYPNDYSYENYDLFLLSSSKKLMKALL